MLEVRAASAPTPRFRALPVEDLLERISELEAAYHLNVKLWMDSQLPTLGYWDRRQICEFCVWPLRGRAHTTQGLSSTRW